MQHKKHEPTEPIDDGALFGSPGVAVDTVIDAGQCPLRADIGFCPSGCSFCPIGMAGMGFYKFEINMGEVPG